MTESELPVVAIIGRPNVGKSTLFNRIIGEQAAIVENRPGVTRDRKQLEAEWLGVPFIVIDTGGWMPGGSDLDAKVSRQVETAVTEADVVLFVVDAAIGMTDDDGAVADWLRRGGKDVVVVANKSDNTRREDERWEFMALGLGEPYPISALHGRRAGDLLDVVISLFPERALAAGSGAVATTATSFPTSTRPRRRWPWRATTSRSTVRRRGRPTSPGRREWPSSGDPTSARAPCSTDSSVRTGRWSMTSPAPPGTPSTRWSRPRTDRSCSSTPPACAVVPRSTTRPSTTRWSGRCVRSTTPTSPCW